MKYIDFSKIKAFVQISIAPTIEWGARSLVLSAGLGGMRPNIVMLGFYNINEYRNSKPLIDIPGVTQPQTVSKAESIQPMRGVTKGEAKGVVMIPDAGGLPTDSCRPEKAVGAQSYVNILEDLVLSLQTNVAIAKGFSELKMPQKSGGKSPKKFIDLWPIQMAAEIEGDSIAHGNLLTTNFDTYTLILQLVGFPVYFSIYSLDPNTLNRAVFSTRFQLGKNYIIFAS